MEESQDELKLLNLPLLFSFCKIKCTQRLAEATVCVSELLMRILGTFQSSYAVQTICVSRLLWFGQSCESWSAFRPGALLPVHNSVQERADHHTFVVASQLAPRRLLPCSRSFCTPAFLSSFTFHLRTVSCCRCIPKAISASMRTGRKENRVLWQ